MKNFKSIFQEISPTIRFLTLSDAIITTGLGLFGPIFAVYLEGQIVTQNALEVIAIGASIYLFTRSIGQIPLAWFIDKVKGERDDFLVLLVGNTIFVIVPILYIFITQPWHLFLIQFIYGLGSALVYPAWLAIFSRHIDKGREGTEWGIYQTIVDMAGAVSAPIGGFVASVYGFAVTMICASVLSAVSSLFIFSIKDDLKKPKSK